MRLSKGSLLASAVLLTAGGCAIYHPKPLTYDAVNSALAAPDRNALKLAVDSLQSRTPGEIPFNLSDGVNADEAGLIALLENPTLKAERDRRGLAEAQLLQARLLPDPTVDASVDVPSGGTRDGAVRGSSVGPGWDVGSLITHFARVREARHTRKSIQLDLAWNEWQVVQEARVAVYRLATLQQQEQLAKETDANLGENARAVKKAFDEGVMTELNLSAAEAASNQAHSQYLALKRDAMDQRYKLLRILGLPMDASLELEANVEAGGRYDPAPVDSLVRGVQQRRLDLIALRQGYAAQEERVRAAILGQFPDIQLGVNRATDTGNLITSGLGISISLPLFDHNRGEIAVERATRQALLDEYTSRVYATLSDITMLHATVSAINEQIAAAETSVPSLQRLVDTYRNAVGERQADILSYYGTWNDLTDKRIELLSLRQDLLEARVALDIAAGIYTPGGLSPALIHPVSSEDQP